MTQAPPALPIWDEFPHVLHTHQFSAEALEVLVQHTQAFEKAFAKRQPLPRKSRKRPWLVKLMFFEASTRTEDTSWLAAHRLHMRVRTIPHPQTFSSAAKGESLTDAIAALTRVGGLGEMRAADCLVIRHKDEGSASLAAKVVDTANGDGEIKLPLPVINAGDGTGQHPTQSFVDLYTIHQERRNGNHPLENITVLFSGDLKRGRTVNSLLYLLGKFGERHTIRVLFSTHSELGPKQDILQYLARHRIHYEFVPEFPNAIPQADVIYMTRIQRERSDGANYTTLDRGRYVFRKEYLSHLKTGAFVMHPLPINRDPEDPPAEIDDELTPLALKKDPRCAWFRQSHRGVPVRAALFDIIFAHIDAMIKKQTA
jgi:aspartate carbamoyltransferase catalytic subunit